MSRSGNGGFLISKIERTAGRIFAKLLKEHGIEEINPAQGRILYVLWKEDGIPISELSRRTGLEKSTLTSMLDRLERSRQLVRERDPADRRSLLIRLTEENRRMHAAYEAVSSRMNDLFYLGFSDEEALVFERMLSRILDNLERG